MIHGYHEYGENPLSPDYEVCSFDQCPNEEPADQAIRCEFCGRAFCDEHGAQIIDDFRQNVCARVSCLKEYVRELELGSGGPSLMARIGRDLERLLREARPEHLKVIELSLRCLAESAKAKREAAHV